MNNSNACFVPFHLPVNWKGFLILSVLWLFVLPGNGRSSSVDCTPPSLPVAGSNAPVCVGADIYLTSSADGTAPFSYVWEGPDGFSATDQNPTIAAATVLSQGIYTVTITNACGSTNTTINVTVNTPVVAPVTGTTAFSVGSTTQLSNVTPGGVWSSSNVNIATVNGTGLVFGASSGTSTIAYTVTDVNSCTASSTANVTVGSLVFDIGIFNTPVNSNVLEIRIKPLVNVVNGDYTAGVFTVRVPVAADVSLTAPGIINSTLYNYVLSYTGTDGAYNYYSFGFDGSYPPINWLANTEHTIAILEHSGSCNGTGLFEIVTPYFEGNINGSYYQELNGQDAQNIIYQPVAGAPLDIIPPGISCPADAVATTDPGFCSAVFNGLEPVAADNCPGYAVIYSTSGATVMASLPTGVHDISGAAFNKGVTQVLYTIIDASGLMATCNFTVTVTDNEAPTITCNPPVLVNNDLNVCGAEVNFSNSAGDNCPGWGVIQTAGLSSGSVFPVGITTNSFTVTDAAGLTATCNFTVTVTDNEAPVITCNPPITVNNDLNTCGAVVSYNNIAGDNCPGWGVNQTAGLSSGSVFPVGNTTNSFTVTDAVGLTATCNFTVTVTDSEAPVITCNTPITVNNDPNTCGAVANFSNSAGDNCPGWGVMQTAGLSSGSVFPVGATTNSFTVTDAAGLTATCNFTVTVTDNETPSITCNMPITVNNDLNVCGAVVSYNNIAGDNCPGWGVIQTAGLPSGSVFPVGIMTNSFTVTDAAGLTATCNFTVTVTDNEAPSITCNTPITVNNDLNVCGAEVSYNNSAGDNCPGWGVIQTAGLSSGSVFPVGITTNSFTVTDAAGLTATCNFTVMVTDNEPPSITCNMPITVNNDLNMCGAAVSYNNIAGDNCPGWGVIQTAGLPSGSVFPVGITTNSFTVTDAVGLTATCNFTVTVTDSETPVISCNTSITVNNDPNTCGAVANFSNSAGDNCPGWGVIQTAGLPSGSIFPVGITTNSFTVTDAAGLTATCNFTITVTDNEPPVIVAPAPVNIAVNTNSCSAIVASLGMPIASDNCTSVALSWVAAGASPAAGTELTNSIVFPLGSTTVTWTATDGANHTAVTTQIVTVTTSLSANSINLATDICIGASTPLSFNISGGQGPYTIVYSTTPTGVNTTINNYNSNDPIVVSPAVNTTYALVSVTDVYDCAVLSALPPAILTVNPLPTAPNTTATSCSGAPVGFHLQNYMNFGGGNGVNADFSWYVVSDNPLVGGEILVPTSGDVITNVLTNNTPFPQGVVYRITPTGDPSGCVGPYFDVTVLVYPTPAAVAADKTICSGTSTDLEVMNVPAVFGASFLWTADYGAVTGGMYNGIDPVTNVAFGANAINEVLINNTPDPIAVTYTITPAGSPPPYCQGLPITVVVTVIPEVGVPVVTGPAAVCQDDADALYTAIATNNTGIVFSVSPAAAGVIHPVTGVMNWDANFTGPATITATATGCNTSEQAGTLAVMVDPLPVLGITQPPAVCVSIDLNTVVYTTNIAGGTYSYHATMADAISNSNALSGALVTAATFDTYVRYTLITGCFTTGLVDVNIGACVQVTAKAMLQGPFNIADNTMFDNLRTGNWIPSGDPYSVAPYNTVFVKVNNPGPAAMINAGVLAVTGNNAIVDWVFVELRDKNNRHTVQATRAALIQRDGDIVDMDGVSPVLFNNMNLDQYYLAVRHRNHLGAMTLATVDYTVPSPGTVNYADPMLPLFGVNPTKVINPGIMGLWAGNTQLLNLNSGKGVITYNGSNNDRLTILNLLGGNQLGAVSGYLKEDVNMNGVATYNGSGNDRVIILNNLGGNQLGNITEQLQP